MENLITVVVPTYNAGKDFNDFCRMLKNQTAIVAKVIVIDSSSTDNTVAIARKYGFSVKVISKNDFGHGKTRQIALEMAETEIVCFLTQDALLADNTSVEKLVSFLFQDELLGAVYGRQLPNPHTGILGAFARIYNYPEQSFINCFEDRERKGLKTAFLSDTFSAYKKSVLQKVGGFPLHSNFGEDSYVAAKMLMAGYKTGYCAEAKVFHAHDYTFQQEWNRAKEIKQFHNSEPWLLETFGRPEGEGVKFLLAQIEYLAGNGYLLTIPVAIIQDIIKFLGYKVG